MLSEEVDLGTEVNDRLRGTKAYASDDATKAARIRAIKDFIVGLCVL